MPIFHQPIPLWEKKLPFYVCGVGIDLPQDDVYRFNGGCGHPQFVIFTQGEGRLVIEGDIENAIPLKENSAFFMPTGVEHYYTRTKGDWKSWWVYFGGYGVPDLLKSFGFDKPCIYTIPSPDRLLQILRRIYSSIEGDEFFGNYHASAYLYDYILEFYKCTKLSVVSQKSYDAISAAIEYIRKEYHNKITLDNLCHIANLSESHFCRQFKSRLGMRPIEYVNRCRIQEAKRLLSFSYKSVEAIAAEVGFESPSYFGKLFLRYEGCSPSQYREKGLFKDDFPR